jgi:hypothetical protein
MITASFTDPQNAVHSAAILCILSANINSNESESYSLDQSDYTTVTNLPAQTYSNVNYVAIYWINAAAKQAGAEPYVLTSLSQMGMGSGFNFVLDSSYDGLTLVEKCEKHLADVILLPMLTP